MVAVSYTEREARAGVRNVVDSVDSRSSPSPARFAALRQPRCGMVGGSNTAAQHRATAMECPGSLTERRARPAGLLDMPAYDRTSGLGAIVTTSNWGSARRQSLCWRNPAKPFTGLPTSSRRASMARLPTLSVRQCFDPKPLQSASFYAYGCSTSWAS